MVKITPSIIHPESEIVNIVRHYTKVGKGIATEKIAMKLLKDSVKQGYLSPFDINWFGFKVDVKSSFVTGKNKCFRFTIKKNDFKSDYLLCLGFSNRKLDKAWFIPVFMIPKKKMLPIIKKGISKWNHFLMYGADYNPKYCNPTILASPDGSGNIPL